MSATNGGGGGGGAYDDAEDAEMGGGAEGGDEKWGASLVAEFDEHKCVFILLLSGFDGAAG